MKLLLLLLILGSAHAADRTPYPKEAARELGTYLQFAQQEPSFLRQLNETEALQLRGMLEVLRKLPTGPAVDFSNEGRDFVLNPGEPERSAKTTDRLEDPIWFNLRKLNAESGPNYLSVVQLLVHEIGHKLGASKNQAAVDSLAAKLGDFLRPYYRAEPIYLSTSTDGRRPLRELLEFLSVPKKLSSPNPNPSFFYVGLTRVVYLRAHFEKSLASQDKEKLVKMERAEAGLNTGALDGEIRLSLIKEFTTRKGEKVRAVEGTFRFAEPMPFMDKDLPISDNFRLSRAMSSYTAAPFSSIVQTVRELERSAKTVSWDVVFSREAASTSAALIAGTEDRPFLIPCEAPRAEGASYRTRCKFSLPPATAISILDVTQLLTDGEAIDLPSLVKLDLEEDFKVPFALADIEPKAIRKVGGSGFALTMSSSYAPVQLRFRCPVRKEFSYSGEKLGWLDTFEEEVRYAGEFPIKKISAKEFELTAACRDGVSLPREILITDSTLYSSRPRLPPPAP